MGKLLILEKHVLAYGNAAPTMKLNFWLVGFLQKKNSGLWDFCIIFFLAYGNNVNPQYFFWLVGISGNIFFLASGKNVGKTKIS